MIGQGAGPPKKRILQARKETFKSCKNEPSCLPCVFDDHQLHPDQIAGLQWAQEYGPERPLPLSPTSIPSSKWRPSVLTPTATTTWWFTLAMQRSRQEPRTGTRLLNGRVPKTSSSVLRSAQIRDTSDLRIPVVSPKALTTSATSLMDTPITIANRAWSDPPAPFQQARKNRLGRGSLGSAAPPPRPGSTTS